jgi:hypothetical protein
MPRKKELAAALKESVQNAEEYLQRYKEEQAVRKDAQATTGRLRNTITDLQREVRGLQRELVPGRLSGVSGVTPSGTGLSVTPGSPAGRQLDLDQDGVAVILAVLASMPAYRDVFTALAGTLASRESVAADAGLPQRLRDSNAPGSGLSRQAFLAAIRNAMKTSAGMEE